MPTTGSIRSPRMGAPMTGTPYMRGALEVCGVVGAYHGPWRGTGEYPRASANPKWVMTWPVGSPPAKSYAASGDVKPTQSSSVLQLAGAVGYRGDAADTVVRGVGGDG